MTAKIAPDWFIDEFHFMRSILGTEGALYRLGQAYGLQRKTIMLQLNRAGIRISDYEVAA